MMFRSWRLKLRQAEQALRDGQLAEAAQRLHAEDLLDYLPGRKLAARVADAMSRRAEDHLRSGDAEAAWRQWDEARQLVGETPSVLGLQREMVGQTLANAERELSHKGPQAVAQRLEPLRRRQLGGQPRAVLEEVAKRLESAQKLARRGRFLDAQEQLNFAAELRPDLPALGQAREQNSRLRERCRELDEQLHRALRDEAWSDALGVAETLLELAPEHRIAIAARQRAWAQVGGGRHPMVVTAGAAGDTAAGGDDTSVPLQSPSERFLLWVDAVGGYLVCLGSELVIGQAGAVGVDIPLLADLSRRHAKLRRVQDNYVLEPIASVSVGGRELTGPTLLQDGDELELGRVRLRFRRPHALSCSARLEFLSSHRPQPSADAVLLMAESCVLGPGPQNHVVCRNFGGDVVLFRRNGQLHCRSLAPMEVDGKRCDGTALLRANSHLNGDDFSLTLEPC